MLILNRRAGEFIDLTLPKHLAGEKGIQILVKTVDCETGVAEIGIKAPDSITIIRREIRWRNKQKKPANSGDY